MENSQVVEVGLQNALVTHHAHLERLPRWLVCKQAKMQRALRAVGVIPTHRRVVVYLVGAGDDAVDGVAAERTHTPGPGTHPPVHQVKVMAVFIDETAAALSPVLNPFARLGLERPAKFLAPCHVRRANRARIHQLFELPKKRRVPQLMANQQHAIAFRRGAQQLAALGRRDADGLLEKKMFSCLERLQRQRHMGEVGRGNHHRIEVAVDEVAFIFKQPHLRRHLHCAGDASGITGAQGDRLRLPPAFPVKQLQMAEAHGSRANKTYAYFPRHAARTLPEAVLVRQARRNSGNRMTPSLAKRRTIYLPPRSSSIAWPSARPILVKVIVLPR